MKYMLNEDIQIDKMIQPLIKAMNDLDWIITNLCCQGHQNNAFNPHFHVQFFCSMSKINLLSEMLNNVSSFIDGANSPFILHCEFNYDNQVFGSQSEAPQNSIALSLTLKELEVDIPEDKKLDIINYLANEFIKLDNHK